MNCEPSHESNSIEGIFAKYLSLVPRIERVQGMCLEGFPKFYSICAKFISYPIIDKFALVHMNNVCANSIEEVLRMGYDYQGSLVTERNSNFSKIVIYKLIIYMQKFHHADWLRACQITPNSAES